MCITANALSLIHISEPTRLGMISYAVFCLKKKKKITIDCITIDYFFLMIRRPPRSTQSRSSAASDVYKRQVCEGKVRPRLCASRRTPDQAPCQGGRRAGRGHVGRGTEQGSRRSQCNCEGPWARLRRSAGLGEGD